MRSDVSLNKNNNIAASVVEWCRNIVISTEDACMETSSSTTFTYILGVEVALELGRLELNSGNVVYSYLVLACIFLNRATLSYDQLVQGRDLSKT